MMGKIIWLTLLLTAQFAATSRAEDFQPNLLKLNAELAVIYDFDGSELLIPIIVSGTPAGIIFSVFTKDKADNISNTVNGYLGWHQVNKIDTCIYYSPIKNYDIGQNEIIWDVCDQDRNPLPSGNYTYYLWGFDNQGAKIQASSGMVPYNARMSALEIDDSGLPLANPVLYETDKRWTLGTDYSDSTLIEKSALSLPEGWVARSNSAIDPNDYNYFYVHASKSENNKSYHSRIFKMKWVPGGNSESVITWANNGSVELPGAQGISSGLVTDGDYLFTTDSNHFTIDDAKADFYIYTMDGNLVTDIDISSWWSSSSDYENGGQMNGGPSNLFYRNNYVFLNCHCSCLKQMVDPYRYLQSGNVEDFYVWSNGNGDYTLDHNFEETAEKPWVCNDYNVGPYTYNISADNNLFSICPSYDAGAVSFGLFGPDGTGLGYHRFANETAGYKYGNFFVDSGTAFDGIYSDDGKISNDPGGCATGFRKGNLGTDFTAHDSFKGIISMHFCTDVADVTAPTPYTLSPNHPNPFNPVTAIPFTLATESEITLTVYNVAGEKIATLADGNFSAGSHSLDWNASEFASGVYFYRLTSGSFVDTRKMTLVK